MTPDDDLIRKLETFFRRHEIRSLEVSKGEGISRGSEISNINLRLINDKNSSDSDYPVHFKLQSQCKDIHKYLDSIRTEPSFSVNLKSTSETVDITARLSEFIDVIGDRVKSALKEQTVQNIRYVGNTFILNNSTRFRVLSDEGEGRLNIEVLTKDKPLDAKLTASGLLDGLYLGSIKLLDA